jgi:hypothetical protein
MSEVQMVLGAPPVQPAKPETPSQAIIKDANRVAVVTDERGRKLGVKSVKNGLVKLKLARILGADATIPAVISECMIYCSVVSIDGDPVPFPRNEAELYGLVQRLDIDGLSAAGAAQRDEFGFGAEADLKEEAKN